MLMLNMQSSIQMLPLLQQKQLQQKQNNLQFQTYLNQMQALNSMLHTLSYGTPLSELNKLHSGVKNQFEGYNNEVDSPLTAGLFQTQRRHQPSQRHQEGSRVREAEGRAEGRQDRRQL